MSATAEFKTIRDGLRIASLHQVVDEEALSVAGDQEVIAEIAPALSRANGEQRLRVAILTP